MRTPLANIQTQHVPQHFNGLHTRVTSSGIGTFSSKYVEGSSGPPGEAGGEIELYCVV